MSKEEKLTDEERMKILEILYPTLDYDLMFYPNNIESCLDNLNIPKYKGKISYVISSSEELLSRLKQTQRDFYDKVYGKKD